MPQQPALLIRADFQAQRAVVAGGGLAAETLRCGCGGKFCRRPRLSQGIRIFHYTRKWHRLQILQSIQAQCVCMCVPVSDSHHATLPKKCNASKRNQCTAHVSSVCVLHKFLLSVVFSLVSTCSLYLNSTTTTYCSYRNKKDNALMKQAEMQQLRLEL